MVRRSQVLEVRLDNVNRGVDVFLSDLLEPRAKQKLIAEMARRELAEAENHNRQAIGSVPDHRTWVDGREDAPLESVNPEHGVIHFEFELHFEIFEFIRHLLETHSPVGTRARPGHPGLYLRSHVMTADNRVIEEGESIPMGAREFAFINTQPYARKIERGLSRQAPDGVYEVVAALANDRYSNVANVKFSYRSPLYGAVNQWADTAIAAGRATERNRHRTVRQPAVVVTFR